MMNPSGDPLTSGDLLAGPLHHTLIEALGGWSSMPMRPACNFRLESPSNISLPAMDASWGNNKRAGLTERQMGAATQRWWAVLGASAEEVSLFEGVIVVTAGQQFVAGPLGPSPENSDGSRRASASRRGLPGRGVQLAVSRRHGA